MYCYFKGEEDEMEKIAHSAYIWKGKSLLLSLVLHTLTRSSKPFKIRKYPKIIKNIHRNTNDKLWFCFKVYFMRFSFDILYYGYLGRRR